MSLTITLQKFNLPEGLNRIPELDFSSQNEEYWLLLSFFEKIEEETGKLIDLGSSESFTPDEQVVILELLDKEIEANQAQVDKEAFFERDEELRVNWLNKLIAMVKLGINHQVDLLCIADDDLN